MAPAKRRPVIYTVGHSNRQAKELVGLLEAHGIEKLVDVRSIPKSRHNPQFNEGRLRRTLARAGIRYEHLKRLGGLRHARKDSKNVGWRNASFRGFADYMATEEFRKGLSRLAREAKKTKIAVMCAEAVPWRCHRSLIADALTVAGWQARHIQSRATAALHRRTPFLRVRKGVLTYPVVY